MEKYIRFDWAMKLCSKLGELRCAGRTADNLAGVFPTYAVRYVEAGNGVYQSADRRGNRGALKKQ